MKVLDLFKMLKFSQLEIDGNYITNDKEHRTCGTEMTVHKVSGRKHQTLLEL